ncbi:MAG: hypothetical protein AB7G37_16350 [Solirubrobacteraceae bacterium]
MPALAFPPYRSSIATFAVALVLLIPASGARAATGGPDVSLERCTPGTTPAGSSALFVPKVSTAGRTGVRSFGFRLRLQQRPLKGGRWRSLSRRIMPGRGRTLYARSGASMLERKLDVQGLEPGYRYRLRVTAVWRTADGTRRATRTSRACRVPERRPMIAVATDADDLRWAPGVAGGQVVYAVPLDVRGTAGWTGGDLPVEIRQDGELLGRAEIDPTAAPDVARIAGARCDAARPVTVTVVVDRAVVRDPDRLTWTGGCVAAAR